MHSGRSHISEGRIRSCSFGFNGQEKDNEVYGEGNSYTAEYWQYDPRIGRRWNVDPATGEYAHQSPYVCFNDNPIYFKDPSGLEGEGVGDPVKIGNKLLAPENRAGIEDAYYQSSAEGYKVMKEYNVLNSMLPKFGQGDLVSKNDQADSRLNIFLRKSNTAIGSVEPPLAIFGQFHEASTYRTTAGEIKDIYTQSGKVRSLKAQEALNSLSKLRGAIKVLSAVNVALGAYEMRQQYMEGKAKGNNGYENIDPVSGTGTIVGGAGLVFEGLSALGIGGTFTAGGAAVAGYLSIPITTFGIMQMVYKPIEDNRYLTSPPDPLMTGPDNMPYTNNDFYLDK